MAVKKLGVGIKIEGDKQLQRTFDALKLSKQKQQLRNATAFAMIPGRTAMRENVKRLPMSAEARSEYAKQIAIKNKTYTNAVVSVVGPKAEKLESGRNWAKLSHLFEFGTSPHEIAASAGKMLSFVWQGSLFRTQSVDVEGIQPTPHVYPSLKNNERQVKQRFATRLMERVRKIAASAK